MNNQRHHIAITLLELANLIKTSRTTFSVSRFQSINSTSKETVLEYRNQVYSMFAGLPSVDLSEEQSFFVAEINPKYSYNFNNYTFACIEIKLDEINRIFPLTSQGKQIFLATERLPGIFLHEPVFEGIWNDYFLNWHSAHTVKRLADLANEFVQCDSPEYTPAAWSFFINLVNPRIFNKDIANDKYSNFVSSIVSYKRDIEKKPHYNDTSISSYFSDFFLCLFNSGECHEIKDQCRGFIDFCKKRNDESIIELASTSEFIVILDAINASLCTDKSIDACGLLLYLYIKIQIREGDVRSLHDFSVIFERQTGFSKESIQLAIILTGIHLEQDDINDFIYSRNRHSFGAFFEKPVVETTKERVLPTQYFEVQHNQCNNASIVNENQNIDNFHEQELDKPVIEECFSMVTAHDVVREFKEIEFESDNHSSNISSENEIDLETTLLPTDCQNEESTTTTSNVKPKRASNKKISNE